MSTQQLNLNAHTIRDTSTFIRKKLVIKKKPAQGTNHPALYSTPPSNEPRNQLSELSLDPNWGTEFEIIAGSQALQFNCQITNSNSVILYKDIFHNAQWPTIYLEYHN